MRVELRYTNSLMGRGHDNSMETVRNAASMMALAIATGAFAVGLLYTRWRKWIKFRGLLLVTAGALAAASLMFWNKVGGPEFGPAYAAINFAIVAWIFVLANLELRDRRRTKGRRQYLVAAKIPGIRSIARHGAIFLVAFPLAAVASTFVSIAVSDLLPWNEIDRIVFPLFAMPVVWGCVAYWTCSDPKLWRPTLSLLACGSVSAVTLFM